MLTDRKKVRGVARMVAILAVLALCSGGVSAQEAAEKAPEEGPPLPLHTIEGVGGLVLTPTAYLVNPGPPGTKVGKPAFAAHFAMIGDRDFEAASMTWTFFERLELGYAINRLALDDLDRDVRRATRLNVGVNELYLHHLNARLNVIRENEWDTNWVPAVTVGAHYKHNNDIKDLNRDLRGALEALGLNDNDGVDFTLTTSKTLTMLPRPVIASAGLRASKASQLGFQGFTDDYAVTFEGNLVMLVTDRLAIGTEYRQKQADMDRLGDLVRQEDSWWDVHAAYIINNNAELYATVGNAGDVLNHSDETLYGVVFKYEF